MGYRYKIIDARRQEAPFLILEKSIYNNLNVASLGIITDVTTEGYRIQIVPKKDYLDCYYILSNLTVKKGDMVLVLFLDNYKILDTEEQKATLHDYKNSIIIGKLNDNDIISELNSIKTSIQLLEQGTSLEMDDIPTQGSSKLVKSGGVFSAIKTVAEIAEGKSKVYVLSYASNEAFNSQNNVITVESNLTAINNTTIDISKLKAGDIILVTETEVPDRWVGNISNGTISLYKMETTKVVLPQNISDLYNDTGFITTSTNGLLYYYTKTEIDNLLLNKVNKVSDAVENNIALFDANGHIKDSGKSLGDVGKVDGVDVGNTSYTPDGNKIIHLPAYPNVPSKLSDFTDDLGSNPTHTHAQYLNKKPDNVNALIDNNNKLSLKYLPDTILGQLLFGGIFSASTSTATLTPNAKTRLNTNNNTLVLTNDTSSVTGYGANDSIFYVVDVAGTFAGISFSIGDWLISIGNGWKKVDNTDEVTSVNGKTGAVSLGPSDIGAYALSIGATLDAYNIQLSANTLYKLTAGGSTYVFKTPVDTHNSHKINSGLDKNGSAINSASASSGDITLGDSGASAGVYGDSSAQTPSYGSTFKVPYIRINSKGIVTEISEHTVKIPASDNTDTKNTAGSTDTSSKIYLIGATSQGANPQTYSDNEVYAQNGLLGAKSVKINEKATIEYNSTDDCIDFVFS